MLDGKMVTEKWKFWRPRNEGEDQMKVAWIKQLNSLKGLGTKQEDEVALTTVSKLSPEQFHEKRWLKAP